MEASQSLCADNHKEFVIETTGNGAIIFDCDNDVWPGTFPQWFDGRGLAKDQAPGSPW